MTPNIILSAFLEVGLGSGGWTDRGQVGRRRHWDGGPEGGSRRGAEDRLAVATDGLALLAPRSRRL